jgi:hypothetical protein
MFAEDLEMPIFKDCMHGKQSNLWGTSPVSLMGLVFGLFCAEFLWQQHAILVYYPAPDVCIMDEDITVNGIKECFRQILEGICSDLSFPSRERHCLSQAPRWLGLVQVS